MNKTSAKQWLEKSWHNISGAKLFYEANHYTDVTAVEIHYSIEKSLKAFLAYENKQIPKTHDLINIYKLVKDYIDLDNNLLDLKQITTYHIEESYPVFDRNMPNKYEIKEAMDFAFDIFYKVCKILTINPQELK
jgi:HEPN domain-containing protein